MEQAGGKTIDPGGGRQGADLFLCEQRDIPRPSHDASGIEAEVTIVEIGQSAPKRPHPLRSNAHIDGHVRTAVDRSRRDRRREHAGRPIAHKSHFGPIGANNLGRRQALPVGTKRTAREFQQQTRTWTDIENLEKDMPPYGLHPPRPGEIPLPLPQSDVLDHTRDDWSAKARIDEAEVIADVCDWYEIVSTGLRTFVTVVDDALISGRRQQDRVRCRDFVQHFDTTEPVHWGVFAQFELKRLLQAQGSVLQPKNLLSNIVGK